MHDEKRLAEPSFHHNIQSTDIVNDFSRQEITTSYLIKKSQVTSNHERENWKSEKQHKWELRKSDQKLVGAWLVFGSHVVIGNSSAPFRFHLNMLSISECHASTVKTTCLDKLLTKTHLKVSVKVVQSHFKEFCRQKKFHSWCMKLKMFCMPSLAHQWIHCSQWVPSEWEFKRLIKASQWSTSNPSVNVLWSKNLHVCEEKKLQ